MTIPDPYNECLQALIAYLQELTGFFPNDWQVSTNDANIARGGDYFVVLRPGSFPVFSKSNTGQIVDYDWGTVLDLYTRYTEYEVSWELFGAVRAALIWTLGINPTLACSVQTSKSATNVWGVTLSSEESAQYFKFANAPEEATPNFIIQTMQVTIRQRVEFPF